MNDTPKKTRTRKAPAKNVVNSAAVAAPVPLSANPRDSDKGEAVAAAVSNELSVRSQTAVGEQATVTERNTLPVAVIPELTGPELRESDKLAARLTEMSSDIAWLLVGAGVAGIILPGVLGTPFFVVGVLVLLPGRAARIERWRKKYSSSIAMNIAMKQINRFLDDIDNRYPRRIR